MTSRSIFPQGRASFSNYFRNAGRIVICRSRGSHSVMSSSCSIRRCGTRADIATYLRGDPDRLPVAVSVVTAPAFKNKPWTFRILDGEPERILDNSDWPLGDEVRWRNIFFAEGAAAPPQRMKSINPVTVFAPGLFQALSERIHFPSDAVEAFSRSRILIIRDVRSFCDCAKTRTTRSVVRRDAARWPHLSRPVVQPKGTGWSNLIGCPAPRPG
jgi:hypothetical protein